MSLFLMFGVQAHTNYLRIVTHQFEIDHLERYGTRAAFECLVRKTHLP